MSTPTQISERIAVAPEALDAFCQRWHIARLEAFGSVLREDFGSSSDVDFLASFEPGEKPTGLDWFKIREELADLVGRKVDLLDRQLVERSRNLYRRQHILQEAATVHGS